MSTDDIRTYFFYVLVAVTLLCIAACVLVWRRDGIETFLRPTFVALPVAALAGIIGTVEAWPSYYQATSHCTTIEVDHYIPCTERAWGRSTPSP